MNNPRHIVIGVKKLVRAFKLCGLFVCGLAGCSDLPDANQPAVPTASGNVVCMKEGRGGYDWQLDDGKFYVARPLDWDVFRQVDNTRVRGLMAQACSNPSLPAFQPTAWEDEDTVTIIQACMQPSAKIDALVERIANLFMEQRFEEGEHLIDILEKYAASVPYTLNSRKLLDLKSPVARRLAMTLDQEARYYWKRTVPQIDAWLATDSALARLTLAAQLGNQRLRRGKGPGPYDYHYEQLRSLVDEIVCAGDQPVLAVELLANLTWQMGLDQDPLQALFAGQFERDPLNPELHQCMASFTSYKKSGDIGQPAACLNRVCEFLPVDQQDAFYALQASKNYHALTQTVDESRYDFLPPPYDLANGPCAVTNIQWTSTGYDSNLIDACNYDRLRMIRGWQDLQGKPDSIWAKEFDRSLLTDWWK